MVALVAAVCVAVLPWVYFWTLFAFGGNTASRRMPVLALAALVAVTVPATAAYRWGRRAAGAVAGPQTPA